MRKQHITSFYVETLLMILVFVSIILVLTHIFGSSKVYSGRAGELTGAVHLAENAAEAVSASDSSETLLALLDEEGNAVLSPDGGVVARYDGKMQPDPQGEVELTVTWEPQGGGLVNSSISVERGDRTIYTLKTAVYTGEVAQ